MGSKEVTFDLLVPYMGMLVLLLPWPEASLTFDL